MSILDRLAELWNLREGRDINWRTILNHMQGVVRGTMMTEGQRKRVEELMMDYLDHPTPRTINDVSEVLRLLDDAGLDPYAAISGEA